MEIRAHVRWCQPKVELGLGQKSLRCRAFMGIRAHMRWWSQMWFQFCYIGAE
jgi:hypothetical protein